jgi:hypothetical protein
VKKCRKLAIWDMLSSTKKHIPQLGMFSGLADRLDQKHPLYVLAHKIQWFVSNESSFFLEERFFFGKKSALDS